MVLYGHTITNKKRSKRSNKQTILLYGGNKELESSCKNREIIGVRTISAAEEKNMDENFVHVLESKMTKSELPVIVKILDAKGADIQKELYEYKRLRGFENSVQMICSFACMDEKARWEHMINAPVEFCNNKQDPLHFIVLEYIVDGGVHEFLNKLPPKHILCSFMIQCVLALSIMGYKYRISHEDLNSGNVLIGKTVETMIEYEVLNRKYRLHTYGIIPKFVDYGLSSDYGNRVPTESEILSDCFTCLGSIARNIRDLELKEKMIDFVDSYVLNRRLGIHGLVFRIKKIFQE